MGEIKSEGFTNSFDVGMPKPRASWTIPSGELREYIPKGESIEDVNKARNVIREYSKRNQQVIVSIQGNGAGTGTLYSVPSNMVLYIDTLHLDLTSTGAARVDLQVTISGSATYIGALRIGTIATALSESITYNNPILAADNTNISYAVGAQNTGYTIVLTGWLEDKTLIG